jgi:hypothetical protein
MGCNSSTPVKDESGILTRQHEGGAKHGSLAGIDTLSPSTSTSRPKLPPHVEAALGGTSRSSAQRRGVSFAGDVLDKEPSREGTPKKTQRGKNSAADDEDLDSPSRTVSVSGRPRRARGARDALLHEPLLPMCLHMLLPYKHFL